MASDRDRSGNTDRIRNRQSWFRNVIASAVTVVLLWKLLELELSVETFDFSDLLSLLVALFAVALSIAFYLKATETSNTFYDNTYRFTKDVSEILGRIEAGFGERLRHLDEGYASIHERMARIPVDTAENRRAIDEEKEKLQGLEKEKNQLLRTLMERAPLQERERNDFLEGLGKKDGELREVRSELALLRRRRLHATGLAPDASGATPLGDREAPIGRLRQWLATPRARDLFDTGEAPATLTALRERFSEIGDALPPGAIRDLHEVGFTDDDGRLTQSGARWLRRWFKRASRD